MLNRTIFITAILPAHNEGKSIAKAIHSIRSYVDIVIVACDNCSDNTQEQATKAGADVVFNTVDNHDRKAGALNQALTNYVNWKIDNQYLLIMDADTQVVDPKRWFSKAESLIYPNRPMISTKARSLSPFQRLKLKWTHRTRYNKLFKGKAYDCVGSIFQAPSKLPHNNSLEEGQRLEWISYMSKILRDRSVFVLTGTCSLISAHLMLAVYRYNNKKQFYNNKSLTEDFCITLDLKECHARMISPIDCQCITATKSTVNDLISQRTRWMKGAIDMVTDRIPDEVMSIYIYQQFMLLISVIAYMLFLIVSVFLYLTGDVDITILWLTVFIIFDVDETLRVWKFGSWFDRIYAMSIIGNLYYSFILQIAYLKALFLTLTGETVYWNSRKQVDNNHKKECSQ